MEFLDWKYKTFPARLSIIAREQWKKRRERDCPADFGSSSRQAGYSPKAYLRLRSILVRRRSRASVGPTSLGSRFPIAANNCEASANHLAKASSNARIALAGSICRLEHVFDRDPKFFSTRELFAQ
jgi:hypothetical protein